MPLDVAPAPLIPPAPRPVFRRRSGIGLINAMRKDTLSIWGPKGYEELIMAGRLFGVFNVLVNDPDSVRRVLAEHAIYARPVSAIRLVRPIIGRGLFLSEGNEWRRQRRALAPAFTPAHVDGLSHHFAKAAEGLLATLGQGSRVQLVGPLQAAALDAASRSLFSLPIGGRGARLARLARGYSMGPGRLNLLDVVVPKEDDLAWLTPGRLLFRRAWRREIDDIIAARRGQSRTEDAGEDVLGLMFKARDPETGEALSDAEVRDQTSTMLAAGFETTGRTMFWTLYCLALDPAEQDRIREEVLADPPQASSAGVARRWPRLRRAIMEALRLYPPVPLLVRRAVQDDRLMGLSIRKGAIITVSPWIIHRHRKLWDQPDAFIPDRFEGKAQEYLTGGKYLPFGEGPRVCIGASFAMTEAALIIATVLSKFRLGVDADDGLMPRAVLTTFPSTDPWFKVTAL